MQNIELQGQFTAAILLPRERQPILSAGCPSALIVPGLGGATDVFEGLISPVAVLL
jgi:hypothetical protein